MNHRSYFFVFVFLCALLACDCHASCGALSCPLDTGAHETPRDGQLRVDASLQYIDQNVPRVGTRRASVGDVPNPDHNEISTINRVWNIRADYDVNSRWGLGVLVPLVSRTHDHFDVEDGTVHHWSFTGVGDVMAEARYAVVTRMEPDAPSLLIKAAFKFPTGRTDAHNSVEPAEITIQPGSGSFDFVAGATYAQSVAKVRTLSGDYAWLPLFASLSYRVNTRGTDDYRMGDSLQANVGSSYPLSRALELLAQVNGLIKEKDHRGATSEDTSFTGGESIYASPGLRWHATRDFSLYGYVQLPLYQRVNKEQDTSAYNVLFGATYRFGSANDRL